MGIVVLSCSGPNSGKSNLKNCPAVDKPDEDELFNVKRFTSTTVIVNTPLTLGSLETPLMRTRSPVCRPCPLEVISVGEPPTTMAIATLVSPPTMSALTPFEKLAFKCRSPMRLLP